MTNGGQGSLTLGTTVSANLFHRAFTLAVRCIATVAVATLLLWSGNDFRPTESDSAIAPFRFNLLSWEIGNAFDKWYHEAVALLPWTKTPPRSARIEMTEEFFRIGEEQRRLERDLYAVDQQSAQAEEIRARLEQIAQRQDNIRPIVEYTVEREISEVLTSEGFASRVGVILPPVDTVLDESPALLVTSPRERILRQDNILLQHGVNPGDRNMLEDIVLDDQNLSAIIVDTGGIGTFPSVVSSESNLHYALTTVAHEWLHNWFFFQPLGQHFWDSPDMIALNETAATLGGWEIGDQALANLTGVVFDRQPPQRVTRTDPSTFDFGAAMRETRQQAERLLAAGQVNEAEAYMEERRLQLVEHGYRIRKINQAYFAFYGSYATSASSDSPIEGQLRRLREESDSLQAFLTTVAGFSSYGDLLAVLDE